MHLCTLFAPFAMGRCTNMPVCHGIGKFCMGRSPEIHQKIKDRLRVVVSFGKPVYAKCS